MSTLAELATINPAASRVFHRHGLDFCCGGSRTLEVACHERGLDPKEVMTEIEREAPSTEDVAWSARHLAEIVDHIVERYHVPLRQELPRLLELARKVEAVHSAKTSCPRGLADHLAMVHQDVEAHMAKEEQILFPMIAAGSGVRPHGPVTVMIREHEEHAANLAKTRALTADFTPPTNACATWRALYMGLADLERELMDHIHLENNILFPRALCG